MKSGMVKGTLAKQCMESVGKKEGLGMRIIPNIPDLWLDRMYMLYPARTCYGFQAIDGYNSAVNWWTFILHHSTYFGSFAQLLFRETGIMGYWESMDTCRSKLASIKLMRAHGLLKSNEPKAITYDTVVMNSLLVIMSALFGLAVIAFVLEICIMNICKVLKKLK